MKLPRRYLPHTVTVEPLTGHSSVGKVYGPAFQLQCMAAGSRRVVRDTDGAEALSTLTLVAEAGQALLVPPGSRVTWGGTTTVVIGSTEHDDGDMGAPQHTEVVCE